MDEPKQPAAPLDPSGRPIPPWEAEQAREALKQAHGGQGLETEDAALDEREREALQKVEREMLIAEAEHRMFANRLESENLARMGAAGSAGGCLRSMGGLTSLLYVAGFGSSRKSTAIILAIICVLAIVLWLVSREFTAWLTSQLGSLPH